MKIICSIGPNVREKEDVDRLVGAGLNMMRFNFSHINYDLAEELIDYTKKSYPKVPIIADLQGNKIRISNLFNKAIKVEGNEEVMFCSENFYAKNWQEFQNETLVPIKLEGNFSLLYGVEKILMKDATMEFQVNHRIAGEELIKTVVVRGGIIRGEKGINVPGIDRKGMNLTSKDKKDVNFALKNKVDIICLSYVTSERNIQELKAYIGKLVRKNTEYKFPKVWAKVECREGIRNFEHILKSVDGIILGRGDLSAELDLVDIPKVQQQLISIMKKSKKEFIIGTYVLESMKYSLVPSIAEVNDLYNFINNRVTGVMLAGEVSVGRYPIETITFLKELIHKYK